MAPRRALADLDPGDIAAALESLAPGSGASVVAGPDGQPLISWQRAEPVPDAAALRAAIAALAARRAAQEARLAARRQRLRQLAQSAVGKDVGALTPAEQRAVLALLLEKLGVLDDDGNVLPLADWS
jgi:hypothetical protein